MCVLRKFQTIITHSHMYLTQNAASFLRFSHFTGEKRMVVMLLYLKYFKLKQTMSLFIHAPEKQFFSDVRQRSRHKLSNVHKCNQSDLLRALNNVLGSTCNLILKRFIRIIDNY